MTDQILPSWRPGRTRDAILEFLVAAESVPVVERVACFDNDGTLWCEKPEYAQLLFFVDALTTKVRAEPGLADTPEFAALLHGDRTAIGELGLERIGAALMSLFEGESPEVFDARVRAFMAGAAHPTLGRPLRRAIYQPMLELIEELRRRQFHVAVVTGGGTEFVRAISADLYGVQPESVVGTLIGYSIGRDGDDHPTLARTVAINGLANEGPAKVSNIQAQLGRRPIIAGGNSGGDRDMLEWATGGDGPRLALLIDHDDADREFDYVGKAETFAESEAITDVGARLGWTVVSMARDWETIFP
jgi:phosphoglycolate phosphatase-like HAD superfamily hydrolase